MDSGLLGVAAAVGRQGGEAISQGDTAWVLLSAALVMLMTPALAFFYGGMVSRKNVLATMMQSFAVVAVISVQWVRWGPPLAFGSDRGGLIGGLEWFGLRGVGLEAGPYAGTIPHLAFMMFQGMFAIITPALIIGAFAERMRFQAFLLFVVLWATLVYDPIAHWVWGGGWLGSLGALDFAGGTVVHISSGTAALAAAVVMGRRLGFGVEPKEPHDLTMVILGAALLWFGWFGFNAGSALGAGGLAALAFVVTNTAAAMAALTWMTLSWWHAGKPSVLGAASGAVAGLVAITPAAGFVGPGAAILIGFGAGALCYYAVRLRNRWRIDDSLDVWGVHGVGGTWGAIATGLFASATLNAAGADGLFYGNPRQLLVQVVAVVATSAYAFVVTWAILKVVHRLVGLRVRETDEVQGLDLAEHGEAAYAP